MIEVTDKFGKKYEIHKNPWLTEHRNLTHQMLLVQYMPKMAADLKEQAYKLSPEYEREQRKLAFEQMLKANR